ncbi:efflux RND transporter periplasmic adaptor subunit [Streptococcus ratti]|uniref:Permease n=1 Tax=Streptococcus ratti FA-1 = DSM 20564 TaxID=699248 RepID=A0ABN0GTF6_STRRT|nr:efflux RND transporter periplasmic adaptor subunit [Streptococcus ratti]EJN93742.1 putative permease [Streptococcus ratti FA-1 = DSM 20564]EMP70645.1 permease [Streptococcus ratti FA-1 = DSM 20564]VEI60056.1 permease [Streptococcus mutans]
MPKRKGKMTKKKKGWIIGGSFAAVAVLLGLIWIRLQQFSQIESQNVGYQTVKVKEGSISSSTLLSGTIKPESEQYVYYDSSKGSNPKVVVAAGDQVTAGQQLVQYDTGEAQAAYDQAVRNLNKVNRQITNYQNYGIAPSADSSADNGSASGNPSADEGNTSGAQSSNSASGVTDSSAAALTPTNSTAYDQQLQDLYDAQASAQDEVNKAQTALDNTSVNSEVTGTVAEVNNDIDPSGKTSKALVHVTSEGKLQVRGTLTEYDLANIKVGQAIKIKSKVYDNKEWDGKISYISNYPTQSDQDQSQGSGSSGSGSSSSAAAYEYKADITSDLGDLKQGFTVSVEVANENKSLIIPTSALVSKNGKNYVWVYDKSNSRVLRKEVAAGNADAKSQEISSGLNKGQVIIANPDKGLKEGKKIDKPSAKNDKAGEKR